MIYQTLKWLAEFNKLWFEINLLRMKPIRNCHWWSRLVIFEDAEFILWCRICTWSEGNLGRALPVQMKAYGLIRIWRYSNACECADLKATMWSRIADRGIFTRVRWNVNLIYNFVYSFYFRFKEKFLFIFSFVFWLFCLFVLFYCSFLVWKKSENWYEKKRVIMFWNWFFETDWESIAHLSEEDWI